jgi:hypothetical protein
LIPKDIPALGVDVFAVFSMFFLLAFRTGAYINGLWQRAISRPAAALRPSMIAKLIISAKVKAFMGNGDIVFHVVVEPSAVEAT